MKATPAFGITALALFFVLLSAGGSVSADVPPGFVEENVFVGYFGGPESIEFESDGTLWIAQSGPGEGMKIWVHRNDVLTEVYDFGTFPTGERGVHAIALDPDYDINHHLWVYHTVIGTPTFNRLSRFTVVADVLTAETVIYDGPTVNSEIHNGGCLAFASDGTLFLGAGDDTSGVAATDPFQRKGKILHMNKDGSPAWDNPHLSGLTGDPLVWAEGVRNPFRCSVQPGTDNLFFADVGLATWEEVNVGVAGGDYGWPFCEGSSNTDLQNPGPCVGNYVLPLHSYNHAGDSAAVIGGVHIAPGQFAPQYEGNYFFADWWTGKMWRIELDASNTPLLVEQFGQVPNGGRIVEFEIGPDGAMYYAARGGIQNIVRVRWVGGDNGQPDAVVQVAPATSGAAPLTVTLDGSSSSDPDDDPLTYDWDLGDGTGSTSPSLDKTYPQGVYDVALTVDDGLLSDSSPPLRIVSGNTPPLASISAPLDGLMYSAGDVIPFAGMIADAEDPGISSNCDNYTWQVIFHHDIHTHPFLGPTPGSCSGSFEIPLLGETSTNTWFQVRLMGSDNGTPIGPGGVLGGETSVEIFPNVSTLMLRTDPPGLQIALDGQPLTDPTDIPAVVNMTRTIDALDGQLSSGAGFSFASWSDGGAAQHDISVPASDTTLTATFTCDALGEVGNVRVQKAQLDQLRVSWSPAPLSCLTAMPSPYRVYMSGSAVPTGAGSFPTDPPFTLVETTGDTQVMIDIEPGIQFFLVTALDDNDQEGPSGHY